MSLQISEYRIVSELGAGGVGLVYPAVNFQTNCGVPPQLMRIISAECRGDGASAVSAEVRLLRDRAPHKTQPAQLNAAGT